MNRTIYFDYRAKLAGGEPQESTRAVDVIASSTAVDSYGEVVLQDWDLTRYLTNPIVLFGHDPSQLPIGRAENVRVEDGKLQARIRFVDASANPLAEQVYQGFRQGSLSAVSVGFRSKTAQPGRVGEKDVVFLSGNELLEISAVALPANHEAIALGRAKSFEALRGLIAESAPAPNQHPTPMDIPMTIKALLTSTLGLSEAASDEDMVAGLTTLSSRRSEVLTLTEAKSMDEALGTIRAWQQGAASCEVLSTRVKTLEEELTTAREGHERASLIATARKAGKLAPSSVAWAQGCPLATLRSFLASAPAIPQLAGEDVVTEPAATNGLQKDAIPYVGKSYADLTPRERHDLYHGNRPLYDSLKAASKAA